jgi:Antirestriction protein
MTTHIDKSTSITRRLVPENQRLAVVEKLFGVHFPLRLEPVIYGVTQKMTQGAYSGGYWMFYTLGDGTHEKGFYMAPDDDRVFAVCSANYWSGELSADALAVTVCLTAYSHLSFGGPESFARTCARHYHLLRQYMMDHAEVAAILGAID